MLGATSLRQFGHLRCAAGLAKTDATQPRQKVWPHAGSDTGSESASKHTAQRSQSATGVTYTRSSASPTAAIANAATAELSVLRRQFKSTSSTQST